MLSVLLNYISDSVKTSVTSIASAVIGSASSNSNLSIANIALQHAAWAVAIIAGALTIVNLFFPLRSFYEERQLRKKEKMLNQIEDED